MNTTGDIGRTESDLWLELTEKLKEVHRAKVRRMYADEYDPSEVSDLQAEADAIRERLNSVRSRAS